jgi:hypothetical protein
MKTKMSVIKTTPSYSPKCPNHGVALEGMGFPMKSKGVGKCPISGADFEFEATLDEDKVVMDKDGNTTKAAGWRVDGND